MPSSQGSLPSCMPLPHLVRTQAWPGVGQLQPSDSVGPAVSTKQAALQPSPAVALPSSHSSPPIFRPSPQRAALHTPPAAQAQPGSTWHTGVQPSPAAVLPSSQASPSLITWLPQRGIGSPGAVSGVAPGGAASGSTNPDPPAPTPLPPEPPLPPVRSVEGPPLPATGPVPRIIGSVLHAGSASAAITTSTPSRHPGTNDNCLAMGPPTDGGDTEVAGPFPSSKAGPATASDKRRGTARVPANLRAAVSWLAACRALDRRVWVLAVARLVVTAGYSMVMPFLAMHLAVERQVPWVTVGLIWFVAGGCGAVAQWLAGELADRLGRRPLMLAAMVARALNLAAMGVAVAADHTGPGSVLAIAALTVMNAVLRGFFDPVAAAMVADLAPPELRVAAYSLQRVGINLGWAAGPAVGRPGGRRPATRRCSTPARR